MTDQQPRNRSTKHPVDVGPAGERADLNAHDQHNQTRNLDDNPAPGPHGLHGGHRWMMIACCIPMLVVVAALVATGIAGTGAIIYAVVCLAMMWLMMKAMPGSH